MFEFMGLPAHPLLVHAAVVLVPLLVLTSIAYAVFPRWRPRTAWATLFLAVVTPILTFLAYESGEALQDVLRDKHYPPAILDKVDEHAEYAEVLLVSALALSGATLLLLLATSRYRRVRVLPSWVRLVLGVLVVVLAVVAAAAVYLTGGSGAEAVWQGVL